MSINSLECLNRPKPRYQLAEPAVKWSMIRNRFCLGGMWWAAPAHDQWLRYSGSALVMPHGLLRLSDGLCPEAQDEIAKRFQS